MSSLHSIINREEYTRSYEIRYVAEIMHLGLGKFRVLKDSEFYILKNKINAQFIIWDEQWEKQETKRITSENKESNSTVAFERTTDAQNELNDLENLLLFTLEIDDAINWNNLKDNSKFDEENPKKYIHQEINNLQIPIRKDYFIKSEKPNILDFKAKIGFLDKIIVSRKKTKQNSANVDFQVALDKWEENSKFIEKENKKINEDFENSMNNYKSEIDKINDKYKKLENKWKEQEAEFYKEQNKNNALIDELKKSYFDKNEQAILRYCEMVLNNSIYPEYFPKDFEIEFNSENGIIVVEYVLPSIDIMPTLKEVKFIASKYELKEYHISETQKNKMYDDVIYRIVLRTIHELFESDKANVINSVVFNGWVNSINKATGKPVNSCIVSIKADKDKFEEIDLSKVDAKACFKSLKGIGSSKLSSLVAIQPIIEIDKSDKRFISSYDVAEGIEGENLALMSWEDFEHLVRELFEKEFSINGGEVKVTQSSRDGGVDAIAFDPDPIRGGKIVIQAKRYTNTVGLSAVRDLYGTVLNEGATKGILVTTADYGSDAYTFAQNKPITLLNGANLLYLLEKHGHKSRIDIKEAKKINNENISK